MEYLKIANWEKWQTYRADRGQPPWIKIHRRLMRNIEWISLSDSERGQLVAMWLLAGDHDGVIPASEEIIQRICFLSTPPDINKFTDLGFIDAEWRQRGVNMASAWRQCDAPKAEESTEENRKEVSCPEPEKTDSGPQVVLKIPLIKKDGEFEITKNDIDSWQETFLGVDIQAAIKHIRQYNIDNPVKRKTKGGIRKHITAWLAKAQDRKQYPRNVSIESKLIQKPVLNRKCLKCGSMEKPIVPGETLCRQCYGVVGMPAEFKKVAEKAFADIPDGSDIEKRKELLRSQAEGLMAEDDIPY